MHKIEPKKSNARDASPIGHFTGPNFPGWIVPVSRLLPFCCNSCSSSIHGLIDPFDGALLLSVEDADDAPHQYQRA